MPVDRRSFLILSAATALSASAAPVAHAAVSPGSVLGLDAAHFGVRPDSPDDQSRSFQRAIEEATRAGAPLTISPGVYQLGSVKLPSGAQLIGVRGATKLVFTAGSSLITTEAANHITLSGLVFDGLRRRLAPGRGLLHFENVRSLEITNCEVLNAGGNGIHCVGVEGTITDTVLVDAADAAIHSLDAHNLLIARNTIRGAGDNGIQVWRSSAGDDGSIVTDNRIENVSNRSGGSGQYGNGVNVFRAGNVIVRGNRIKNCAFSAIRGNAASNIHIEGNSISDVREVALYSEFGFEGALIANNIVDGAAIGISVTNFNEGGRLAVIQGNLIRNLLLQRPAGTDPDDGAGIGIAVEADAAVTGNVVENAPNAGLMLGFGRYMRDVSAVGNVLRRTGIGIGVSVAPGSGSALIANNIIAGAARGAIIGMDRLRIVTGDLVKAGAEKYARLSITGNLVS